MSYSLPDPISLDGTRPYASPEPRDPDEAGYIRYLDGNDAGTLAAHARQAGDLAHRDILLARKFNLLLSAVASNPYFNRTLLEQGFLRADGTVNLTAPQVGVDPVDASHLTTKGWVESSIATVNEAIGGLAEQLALIAVPLYKHSTWTPHEWDVSIGKQVLTFTFTDPEEVDLDKLSSIEVIERLDLAVPTISNPTPTPEYIYRKLLTVTGFLVSDFWLDGDRVLHVAVQNQTFYPSGYPSSSGYESTQTPETRELKAVICCHP